MKNKLSVFKFFLVISATTLWVIMIVAVFRLGGDFQTQAPLCMGGTMILFALLNTASRLLRRYEKRRG